MGKRFEERVNVIALHELLGDRTQGGSPDAGDGLLVHGGHEACMEVAIVQVNVVCQAAAYELAGRVLAKAG